MSSENRVEGAPGRPQETLRKLTPSLTAFARARLGNSSDVDDAVQETFVRVLQNLDAYRPEAPFQNWVFTIAANVIRNMVRGEQTRREYCLPEPEKIDLDPAEALDRTDDIGRVFEALRTLEIEEAAPLLMHYAHGISQQEVAAHFDIPVEHLRVRLYLTIQKIRRAVKGGHS